MKTLADILRESREEIERHGKVIDKLIAESKEAGVVWPETEVSTFNDVEETTGNICCNCNGIGCFLCRHTGEIDLDDPGYDELGAEADREEN